MIPVRLGSHPRNGGIEFAVRSRHATKISVAIFDHGKEERVALDRIDQETFRGHVPGAAVGTRYGFRASGPFDPAQGHYFLENKLLLDPYAREVEGNVTHHSSIYLDPTREARLGDTAPFVPRAVVTTDDSLGTFQRPNVPWEKTVLYELHARGFTKLLEKIPAEQRGTFVGLASEPVLDYLGALGVTTLELLPVNFHVSERALVERGLTNYWGYNPISYFALDPRFALDPANVRNEFCEMVRRLHARGFEVVLDVVFNHTAEGGRGGSLLSYRGLDNRTYYRLGLGGSFVDWTGCGNTLDFQDAIVRELVLESLRYLHNVLGVDGFRFDLAPVLARTGSLGNVDGFDISFFEAMKNDPALANVKWIVEPWDVSGVVSAYGEFPNGFFEWNGVYRDTVRRFWNRDAPYLGDLGRALTGSRDMFPKRDRIASIEFVTAHDGFTLYDLVSYAEKHNLANGENNRDGGNDNASINFGVEGETDDFAIVRARLRHARSLIATLLLSPGVPMLVAGDELLRTQGGNNNAYCLDDETSWLDWSLAEKDQRGSDMFDFVAGLLRIRKERFDSLAFFDGPRAANVEWRKLDGKPMQAADWEKPEKRALGMYFKNANPPLFLVLVAEGVRSSVRLPPGSWRMRVNSGDSNCLPSLALYAEELDPYSVVLFEGRPPMKREELSEEIEIALVELKEIAQPHELSTLREMALDAREAEESQLPAIYEQLRSLRKFCESRKKSDANYRLGLLPRGRRR